MKSVAIRSIMDTDGQKSVDGVYGIDVGGTSKEKLKRPATSSPECARMRRATAAKATADKEASQHTIPTCTLYDCEYWKYDRKE